MTAHWWADLRAHMKSTFGLVFPDAMQEPARRELERLLPGSSDAAVARVVASRSLSQELLDVLKMGLTWFGREQDGIDQLVAHLAQVAREQHRRRVWLWSAGCSSGEEPYGLAMALLDAGLEPRILATDINREHLRLATEGCYRPDKVRAIDRRWTRRYFVEQRDGGYQAAFALRQSVTFELHNLSIETRPPRGWTRFDAVVCRNVLIYYSSLDARRIAGTLLQACRPGGALLVGTVERSTVRGLQPQESAFGSLCLRSMDSASVPATSVPAEASRSAPVPAEAVPSEPVSRGRSQAATATAILQQSHRAEQQGDLAGAIQSLRDAVASEPLWGTGQLALGMLLERMGACDEALPFLRAARFLEPRCWLATYRLARCLATLGQEDEAHNAYRDTLDQIDRNRPSWVEPLPGLPEEAEQPAVIARDCRSYLNARWL